MKSRKVLIICVFVFFLASFMGCRKDSPEKQEAALPAIQKEYERGPIRVRIQVDKEDVTIAENVALTIEAETKEGYEAELPDVGEKLGEFGITDFLENQPELTKEGWTRKSKTYILEPFLSGEYKIEPMKVVFRATSSEHQGTQAPEAHEIETEEITISVRSLLEEDREQLQVHPIFGPLQLPSKPLPLKYILVIVGVVSLIAGISVYFWYRSRRRRLNGSLMVVPPHQLAYRQLQEIIDENLLDQGRFKQFYERISDVLRQYIENRFGLHAPKLTTEEFLVQIAAEPSFDSGHKELLNTFLNHCDLVKFAEYQPAASEIQKTFDSCKAFIEATKEEDANAVGSAISAVHTPETASD
jgi:hypothetical protein